MKTVFGIVVLVGLAITSQASCFKSKKAQEAAPVPEVDLDGLSEYLAGKIPSNDTEANLGQLTKDLDTFSGPMRKAADLALEISKVPAEGCSEELRVLLGRVESAGLRVNGTSRVAQVINDQLFSQLESCEVYIKKTFDERFYADKNATMRLIDRIPASYGCNERTIADFVKHVAKRAEEDLNCGKLVVGEDNKTKKVVDEARFNELFNKYLVERCEEWESKLGDIIRPFESIHQIYRGTPKYWYVSHKAGYFEAALNNLVFCDRVSNMDDILKTYLSMKLCF